MTLNILKKIGLSKGEEIVYETLLELGASSLNMIHEKIGIERRNIYDILNKLIRRGLIVYTVENNKRVFNISHPNRILGYVEEEKLELDNLKQEILLEMPAILNKFNAKKNKISANIYRGKEGIKAIYEDLLNYKTHYFIGGGRYVMKNLPYFWEKFNIRRIKSKIKVYNLVREDIKEDVKPLKYEHIKILPKSFNGGPNVIFIWGDKIANVLFADDFFAFVIESESIADNYKRYHKFLWKIANP